MSVEHAFPGFIGSSVRPGTVITQPSGTKWGANHQGINSTADIITFLNHMNCTYVRENMSLDTYNGERFAAWDSLLSAGKHLCVNVGWNQGNKPRQYAASITNETNYRNRLHQLLLKYPAIELLVVENEPTNQNYFNDSITKYFTTVQWARAEAAAMGFKTADGALHNANFRYTNGIMKADSSSITYLNAMKNAGVDYFNFHFPYPDKNTTGTGTNEKYKANFIKDMCTYVRNTFDLKCMSNEYHQESSVGFPDGNPFLTRNVVDELMLANLDYCILFSGDGQKTDGAIPFANLNTLELLPIGTAWVTQRALYE